MPFDFKIKNNTYIITIFCTILTAVVYCWYAKIQPTYTYSLTDPRLDAHQYIAQYRYFRGDVPTYQVRFPFNARILSSWLAAQLPFDDVKTNFKIINGVFLVLMVLFLSLLWQRLQIRNSLITIGLCWLLFHWKGPVRMYLPDPVTADVGGYFFCAFWLWLLSGGFFNRIKKNRIIFNNVLLCAVAILATLQKEVFIVVTFSYWLAAVLRLQVKNRFRIANSRLHWLGFKISINEEEKKKPYIIHHISYILALSCLTHFIADYTFPASNPDWRNFSVVSLLRGVQRYFFSPELFLRLPVSWFLTFGSFGVGCFYLFRLQIGNHFRPDFKSGRADKVFSRNISTPYILHHISYITALFFILSIFAGGDTSRILMTGTPFVMTFLLLQINKMSVWVGYFVAIASLPLMRLAELEPDLGLYPAQRQDWCVECWPLAESWPYLVYMPAVGLVFWFLISKNLNLYQENKPQL
jgi:hypothetical protein